MTMPLPPAAAEVYGLWLLLDLTVTIDPFYKIITVTTDRSFIAVLFWNCVAPLQEPRLTMRRGVASWRDPHISWHPWGWVRQEEPGDVTVHTFILTAGYHPSYLWFRIEGGLWSELTCPDCESTNVQEFGTWSFVCYNCGYIDNQFHWTCPDCGRHSGTHYSYHQHHRCLDCGHWDITDNFKLKWHNRSYSPFFFEQWEWPPVLGCIFYEPWTYIRPDPPAMYLLFKDRWTS